MQESKQFSDISQKGIMIMQLPNFSTWSVIINKIVEEKSINYGYNAANDTFVDMVAFGIIDPKKVERVALEEAISLAWMFLTTEAAVTEIPKKDDWCNWSCSSWWAVWGMWWMPWMGMY